MALKITAEGDRLVANIDGVESSLSAMEIYKARFKGEFLRGRPADQVEWPDHIDFSKHPAKLIIAIDRRDPAAADIYARPVLIDRYMVEHPLHELPESDHVLTGGTWFPLEEGPYQSVKAVWDIYRDSGCGSLTLSTYVAMNSAEGASRYVVQRAGPLSAMLPALIADEDAASPSGLAEGITLYPYQLAGLRWLKMLRKMRLGGLLGDEMGLGKTLQIIALLADEPPTPARPALIIVPASLIPNWERELAKFAPSLTFLRHHGTLRSSYYRDFLRQAVVLTTYDMVKTDVSMFEMIEWSMMVLDEAHLIRNPETRRFKSLSDIRRDFSVAVTGTPIQNSLKDAWALLDFILPGYCGSMEDFVAAYQDTESDALHLEPRLTPFMLRRTVKEVANDLPRIIHVPQPIEMTETEAIAYEAVRQEILASGGGALAAITPLRQMCCHPCLRDERWLNADLALASKFGRLIELLLDIRAFGEKCIVFTTYNEMAGLIARQVSRQMEMWVGLINGETAMEQRQALIDQFTESLQPCVLVLNPIAAGVGLNIQAANHVIHYNLEWNPAVEDQATARAYRRGQSLPVTVHRLYYTRTIEQVIDERVELKRGLISRAVRGVKGEDSDLAAALELSPVTRESQFSARR